MKNAAILDRLVDLAQQVGRLQNTPKTPIDQIAILMSANRELQDRLVALSKQYTDLEQSNMKDLVRDRRIGEVYTAAEEMLSAVPDKQKRQKSAARLQRALAAAKSDLVGVR